MTKKEQKTSFRAAKQPTKKAKSKSDYLVQKERVREEAIQWQHDFSKKSSSYRAIQKAQNRFEKLGKRYGLLTEFRENGII